MTRSSYLDALGAGASLLALVGCAGTSPSASVALDAGPSDDGAAVAPDAGLDASNAPEASVEGPDAFLAGELLGRPTATSVSVGLVPARDLEAYLELGTPGGAYDRATTPTQYPGGQPFVVLVDALLPDTRYAYRLRWRLPGESAFLAGPARSFSTQRPPGSTFRFTVQADSHLDENSDPDLYRRTLANVQADAPDFHVDLGDTFMCEKHAAPLTATVQMAPDEATVDARYLYERAYFGIFAHSTPLFLANGNHDGELGFLLASTGDDVPTWATLARHKYYLNPTPDAFYSGDTLSQPFVGERASWYSFRWGDALFVVLDPFWNTTTKSSTDGWVWTLGEAQYRWLASTLASSQAARKFVFLHNLVGGLDGQMRGGVEAAPYYEWGGQNLDGSAGFDAHRPGWGKPIHQLLVDARVTTVFHGHDHLYAKQELDGVVYQEVPQPSAKNTQSGPNLAKNYHYASGTILSSAGHVRVTVAPGEVTTEYVRAWLPSSENAQRHNGEIADAYTLPAP